MRTKVEDDATDSVVGLNENEQEPGSINKDTDVTGDQEPKETSTKTNVTYADTDAEIGLKEYTILIQIDVITGNQDDPAALTSITGGTQGDPSTLTSRTGDSKKSSNVTPDKVHRKKLVASSPL